jgi:hypothetical protein
VVNCFHNRFIIVAAVIAATFFLCHCGKKQYRYVDRFEVTQSDEAQAVLNTLLAANSQITRIKGIGNVRFQHNDTQQKLRAAWIGEMPNRFRLELLGITGQPIASLASNGIWNYLLLHTENRFIKKRISKYDLKRFISIKLSIEDLVHFLCGRLPIKTDGAGWIEKETEEDNKKLIYKERTSQFFYHIYYECNKNVIRKIERINEKGELIIRITFHSTILKNGFRIPNAITVTNGLDATFDMTIDNTWINPSVTADKFELAHKN